MYQGILKCWLYMNKEHLNATTYYESVKNNFFNKIVCTELPEIGV